MTTQNSDRDAEDASREDRVVRQFLDAVLTDQEAGVVRSLAEYQALSPGYEARIAAEYERAFAPGTVVDDSPAERIAHDPTRIGHYAVVRRIGEGGQGVVYLATDERLRRPVAVKVLKRLPGGDERALQRFLREARVTSQLDHRGICAIFDSGVDGDIAYLVMRYVEGVPLQVVLANRLEDPDRGDRFDVGSQSGIREVATFFERAARAVSAAHGAGVLHRDLKPGNMMVGKDGDPVLLDFGLAGSLGDQQTVLTLTGELFGTPSYMAPEQLEGDAQGPGIDVYALGVTLYETLANARPYDAPSREGLYRAILAGSAVDVRRLNPRVPSDLAVIVATAMEREPSCRYASSDALAEDLRRFVEGRPILARPVRAWTHVARWGARNPIASSALIALFVVISTALVITTSANRRLKEQIENIEAGQQALRQQKIDGLLIDGYQRGFSVDYEPGKASFREVLELDPGNEDALAGAFLLEMPDTRAALEVLDGSLASSGSSAPIESMRLMARGEPLGESDSRVGQQDDLSPLEAFLTGHHVVGNFMPPVDPQAAEWAMVWFRTAIRRATRPRFHYWHSLMMAAREAGDLDTLAECDDALRSHWPNDPGTYEALAQFWFPFDEDRAIAAGKRLLELEECASGHLLLAEWHRKNARFDDACTEYGLAREIAPELMAVHATEAMGLAQMGRMEEAIRRLEAAIERTDSPELRAMLGQLNAQRTPIQGDA